ncbi:hypothetical protein LTR07_006600 [Exophiala xenobiotica]|nr:hypothetical protein LTR79_007459 [Exophiala xenobiotica]KAK5491353.1 hypothetical protein LTR83_006194 [Exophiala xenobiotica]KAK5516818.1 hypothetical protein LTR07_006600 [Exophiala xenobiotica]
MNGHSEQSKKPFKVIVVGAGLGGLAAAVACLRHGIEVIVLEKAPEISPVRTHGTQMVCVQGYFGLEDNIRKAQAIQVKQNHLKRWKDGKILCSRQGGDRMINDFGAPWFVIHRADYHTVLLDEALRLGADLRKNSEVVDGNFSPPNPYVLLQTGEKVEGDVIIGADGLWSFIRDMVLEKPSPPEPTGDLAYRGTFTRAQLEAFNDPDINELINSRCTYNWMGHNKHTVFYPVKDATAFNLVLIRPDDLPPDSRTSAGDIGEMRMTYEDWDPVVQKIISCHNSVLKWKLCHHEELRTWVSGNAITIGDASHPSLPYQAQGAAMAVEDGCVLGTLLGRLQDSDLIPEADKRDKIHSILELCEGLRKNRTTLQVRGAIANRYMFHLPDGPEQEQRDKELAEVDWVKPCRWQWADFGYQKKMLGFEMVQDTNNAFEVWIEDVRNGARSAQAPQLGKLQALSG